VVTGGLILALENMQTRGRKPEEPGGEVRAPLEALKLPAEEEPEVQTRPVRPEPVAASQVAGVQAAGKTARPGPVRTLRGESGHDAS